MQNKPNNLLENRLLLWLTIGIFLAGTACTNRSLNKGKEPSEAVVGPLTMLQNSDGQWVITDSNKTVLYQVFPYDNGPDYPSEGLIRVLKNGKIGYADANTYKIVIEAQFDCAFPFEDGRAKVSNQCQSLKEGEYSVWTSDNWEYVDKQGKVITN